MFSRLLLVETSGCFVVVSSGRTVFVSWCVVVFCTSTTEDKHTIFHNWPINVSQLMIKFFLHLCFTYKYTEVGVSLDHSREGEDQSVYNLNRWYKVQSDEAADCLYSIISFLRELRYAGMRELTDSLSSFRIFSPRPSEPAELGERARPGYGVL